MMAVRANYSAETKAEELFSLEAAATSTVNHNPADRFSLLIHVDKKRGGRQSAPRRNGKSVNKLLSNALLFFFCARDVVHHCHKQFISSSSATLHYELNSDQSQG